MVIQGVIRPPPEIRAVADRTAAYVAKNGRAFETRILSSSKGKTPKFAFLQPHNPFHAYYQERIQFYENGGTDEKKSDEDGDNDENAAKQKQQQESTKSTDKLNEDDKNKNIKSKATKSAIDPVAKALLTHRNQIAKLKAEQKSRRDEDENNSADAPNQAASFHANIPPPQPLHFILKATGPSLSMTENYSYCTYCDISNACRT